MFFVHAPLYLARQEGQALLARPEMLLDARLQCGHHLRAGHTVIVSTHVL